MATSSRAITSDALAVRQHPALVEDDDAIGQVR